MVDIYMRVICYGWRFGSMEWELNGNAVFLVLINQLKGVLNMKLAICDDEKAIRKYIADCVREVSEDIEIELFQDAEGVISPGFDADILFLDIQMPGINGMKAAGMLRDNEEIRNANFNECSAQSRTGSPVSGYRGSNGKKTVLVFVTALEEQVFNAFEVGAFRYVLKPFEREKLIEVIRKSIIQAESQSRISGNVTNNIEKHNILNIKTGGSNTSVLLSEVAFAEVFDRRIVLHMADGENLEYYGRISELETQAGRNFFRIHRAYLINMKYIKSYDSKHVEIIGTDIPVARGKYQELIKAYLSFQTRNEGL